jgi:murein DD-endopeptidase MepM/ murein hydrolase activator NlpD
MKHLRPLVTLCLCAVLLGTGFFAGRALVTSQGRAGVVVMELVRASALKLAPSFLVESAGPPTSFAYYAPGDLIERSGTGPARKGSADWTPWVADMTFPVAASHSAFLNSQVYGPGGGRFAGAGPNNQCAVANYSYPWRDNFCERRGGKDRESLNCPSRAIHQGVDIRGGSGGTRASTCAQMAWGPRESRSQTLVPVVAAEDGWIEYSLLPHKYVVSLITPDARVFSYMHLDRASLVHRPGSAVSKGETIGYLSNYFGRGTTTHHLHFEILQNIDGKGWSHVPPYISLVRAYERDRGLTGILVEDAE